MPVGLAVPPAPATIAEKFDSSNYYRMGRRMPCSIGCDASDPADLLRCVVSGRAYGEDWQGLRAWDTDDDMVDGEGCQMVFPEIIAPQVATAASINLSGQAGLLVPPADAFTVYLSNLKPDGTEVTPALSPPIRLEFRIGKPCMTDFLFALDIKPLAYSAKGKLASFASKQDWRALEVWAGVTQDAGAFPAQRVRLNFIVSRKSVCCDASVDVNTSLATKVI